MGETQAPDLTPAGLVSQPFQSRRHGRHDTYDPALAEALLARIAAGEDVMKMLREPGMPSWGALQGWRRRHPEFAANYVRAREASAEAWEYRAWQEAEAAVDRDTAAASRVRVSTIQWMASKRNPRLYAEKHLHTGADGEGPIQHTMALDYSRLTEPELLELRRLLDKARTDTPMIAAPTTIDGVAENG